MPVPFYSLPNRDCTMRHTPTQSIRGYDVLVIGGGLSGVIAATAAARNGARTLLVERDGALGGTMTACLVGPMMTFHSATEQVIRGMPQELVDRLVKCGASPGHILDTSGYVATITPFDVEGLRLVAQRMVLESAAGILLHASVTGVEMTDQRVTGVRIYTDGKERSLYAHTVVDATGDATIAALAGAPTAYGRPEDGLVQPVSLLFKVSGWDREAFTDYAIAHPDTLRLSQQGVAPYRTERLVAVCGFNDLLQRAITAGELGNLRREHVLFFNTHRPDEVTVNMSRVSGVNPLDPDSLSAAEVEAREQVDAIITFLRRHIPGFTNAQVVATGSRVGVRESRRIVGEVVLTANDIREGRRWPDAIARSAYPIDIHAPTGLSAADDPGLHDDFVSQGVTYEIPYRALVPRAVDGLIVAGRCISTTSEAHGATRVSPSCMAFGQAAGTAAALAVRQGCVPREVDVSELRHILVQQGASLT